MCSRFVESLFNCPDYYITSSGTSIGLPRFIAYMLFRVKLPSLVTFTSLALLQRLKTRFPTASGFSGHRIFLSTFILASKMICDDSYSNSAWVEASQGIFPLREINQMEREMCRHLEWELNVDPKAIEEFKQMVRSNFNRGPPYRMSVLQTMANTVASLSINQRPKKTSVRPLPSFAIRYDAPIFPVIPRATKVSSSRPKTNTPTKSRRLPTISEDL